MRVSRVAPILLCAICLGEGYAWMQPLGRMTVAKPRIRLRKSAARFPGRPGGDALRNTLSEKDPGDMIPRVYPQRWVQLGYLSLLALMSDWICFSVAASPSTYENAFPGRPPASYLIDVFLIANVFSCFLVTDSVKKFGLSKCVKGAAILMTVGCALRSGAGPSSLASYDLILLGTVLVGISQPFFQCTPPLLSATWFASDERATSTAVALNANQIGIATAFLVGGEMATSQDGLAQYFALISVVCAVVALGTLLQFQNAPEVPPSSSMMEKVVSGEEEPPFWDSAKELFKTNGFKRPLVAFICSITVTNIVGAFIDQLLERGGVVDQFSIDCAGACFELSIMAGGILIGGYVDRTKEYKAATLTCLLGSFLLLVPLGLTDHFLGTEPPLLVLALVSLGFLAGPIQPVNAELAVDVTYPSDETAVESIQQIGGNLVSALLVPVAELASRADYELFPFSPIFESDIRGDVILLMSIVLGTYIYFMSFDAELKRSQFDAGG